MRISVVGIRTTTAIRFNSDVTVNADIVETALLLFVSHTRSRWLLHCLVTTSSACDTLRILKKCECNNMQQNCNQKLISNTNTFWLTVSSHRNVSTNKSKEQRSTHTKTVCCKHFIFWLARDVALLG